MDLSIFCQSSSSKKFFTAILSSPWKEYDWIKQYFQKWRSRIQLHCPLRSMQVCARRCRCVLSNDIDLQISDFARLPFLRINIFLITTLFENVIKLGTHCASFFLFGTKRSNIYPQKLRTLKTSTDFSVEINPHPRSQKGIKVLVCVFDIPKDLCHVVQSSNFSSILSYFNPTHCIIKSDHQSWELPFILIFDGIYSSF